VDIEINDREARVLGSLIEKELTTPDYYPLSLNALTNACNQKSNRHPVVSYTEQVVVDTLEGMIEKGLVQKSGVARVPKYEERLTVDRKLVAREASVLCVLLLRGPQTIGELRGRTARMHPFDSLEDVLETLDSLAEWGWIERLPRMPGQKEARYTHLFCGRPESTKGQIEPEAATGSGDTEARLEIIEQDLQDLRNDLEDLKHAFKDFADQFK
jgi:uncharacterized protein YceH (UPF0502 family)